MGWSCEYCKAGHFKLRRGNNTVVAASSPRNPARALANTVAILKRYNNAPTSEVLQPGGDRA